MPRRDYAGGAENTTITSPVDNTGLSLNLNSSTGWPSGAGGPFSCVLDRGNASEEKIQCSAQSSNVVTIMTRGFDGTASTSHSAGATIEVILTAIEMDETNGHAFDTSRDDHTQYLNTPRHSAIQNDTSMIADGAVTQPKLSKPAVGTPELFDASVTAPKMATGAVGSDSLADGSVTAPKLAPDAVIAGKIADDAVTTDPIAALAVTEPKLAADAVSTDKLVDANVTGPKLYDDQRTYVAANVGALPTPAAAGAAGYTTDNGFAYIWDGSEWTEHSSPLIAGKIERDTSIRKDPGEWSATAQVVIKWIRGGVTQTTDSSGLIAPVAGIYVIGSQSLWDNTNTSTDRQIRFVSSVQGTIQFGAGHGDMQQLGSRLTVATEMKLAAGEELRANFWQGTSGGLDLLGATTWIRRIGP